MDATRAILEKVKAITQDPANVPAALKLGFTKVLFSTILEADLTADVLITALECAANCAASEQGLEALRANDEVVQRLDFIAVHASGSAQQAASLAVQRMSRPASTGAGSASTAQGSTGTGRAALTKALKVSMKGTLGGKVEQAAYIETILLLPGVTSVTIDQARDKIVVYTTDTAKVRPALPGAIREVRARFGLTKSGSTQAPKAYYGEEDDDEAYAATGKNTITDGAGAETVEQRMARKRRARAAAKAEAEGGSGLIGAVASVGSWLWG